MKIINKIKELYYKLGIFRWFVPFVLLFPFMKMSYFRTVMIMTPIYDVFRWVFAGLLIVYAILDKTKLNKLMFVALFMMLWSLINIAIQIPANLWDTFKDCLSIVSIYLIIEIFIDDRKSLIKGFMLNFEIAMYLELILYVFFPNGINTEWVHFLGLSTMLSLYLIPAYCVVVLYYKETKEKIRTICLTICCIACTILLPCATAKLATLGIIGVLVLGYILKEKFNVSIKLWPFVVVSLLIGIFVIFIYKEGKFPFLDNFFLTVFHKRATFTGRSPIWDKSVEAIVKKPLIGYGLNANVIVPEEGGSFRAHNEWLQRLLADGIPGLLTFVGFNYVYINRVDNIKNDIYRILLVGISFAMYVTYCMESYTNVYIYYIVMFLTYNYEAFNKEYTNDNLLK